MRLKAPQTTSTPRRALGAPQPKLRREVAERALQRPRARRAARLGPHRAREAERAVGDRRARERDALARARAVRVP